MLTYSFVGQLVDVLFFENLGISFGFVPFKFIENVTTEILFSSAIILILKPLIKLSITLF
jgi:hypothetical protein